MAANGNVWLYLRKSRALGDSDDAELLAGHRALLTRLAEQDGCPVPGERIIEEIRSGETLRDRPRFADLLRQWQALPPGAQGLVYVMEVDRLSRGLLSERGEIQETLARAGIRVRTPGGIIDLANPDQALLYEFKGSLARHELQRYRQRVRYAWDELLRQGRVITGGKRFGYDWDYQHKRLIPVEPEFSVVVELFERAFTVSTHRLAVEFGIPQPTLDRILHNPVYTGWPARHLKKVRWNGPKQTSAGRWLPLDEWTWPEEPGDYPAAVSREKFLALQQVLARRFKRREKTRTTEGWCKDVVEFEGREGLLIELGSHQARGEGFLTYTTTQRQLPRSYIARETVHAAAREALLRALDDAGALSGLLRQQMARESAEAASRASARDPGAITLEIEERRRRLDDLLLREQDARDAEERASIGRVRDRLREEIRERQRLLDRSLPPAPASAELLLLLARLAEVRAPGERLWEHLTESDRRLIANGLLARIVVRITPQPKRRPWLREVVAVEYPPGLRELLALENRLDGA